jgi:hypothetical protein
MEHAIKVAVLIEQEHMLLRQLRREIALISESVSLDTKRSLARNIKACEDFLRAYAEDMGNLASRYTTKDVQGPL